MKKEDLFEAIGQIGEKYTKDARKPVSASSAWRKWAAAAACLVLVFAGAAAFRRWTVPVWGTDTHTAATTGEETTGDGVTENTMAYGMRLEGDDVLYSPISFEDRIRYGLVPPDAVGLTKENTYKITEDDLGEAMGEIGTCGDESVIGCTVYHFAKFPELDSICIVDLGEAYAFYVADGIDLKLEEGHSADAILEGYDLPNSVTKMELQNGSWETLRIIEDREIIEAFCVTLAGKTDMGLQAHEQRLADAWKAAYGNEDVYYDGETMHYGSDPSVFDSLYDQAHELWGEGELVVWLETERGFRFYFIYKPSIGTISGYGYYPLTEEENDSLRRLLAVDEEAQAVTNTYESVTLTAENVTPTGLTLVFSCEEGEYTTGSYYSLEKKAGDVWEPVPYSKEMDGVTIGWTTVGYSITTEQPLRMDVAWSRLYGTLPAGQYRIGKEIDHPFIIYTEFTIE